MTTYARWRLAADRDDIKRVTWCYGNQHALLEEIIDTTRTVLNKADKKSRAFKSGQLVTHYLDYISLSGIHTPTKEIWAKTVEHLPNSTRRLILIRDAEKIDDWEPLTELLTHLRDLPGLYLLFISNETNLPSAEISDKKGRHAEHIEMLRQRGYYSRIVRAANLSEADMIAWIQRRAPTCNTQTSRHLITRAGGDLIQISSVCAKLALFEAAPRKATIDQLCRELPSSSFVDTLITDNKRQALLAAQGIGHSELSSVIGLLNSRLDLLLTLWRNPRVRFDQRVVTQLPKNLVDKFMPYARRYDTERCARSRRALAVVDAAAQNGRLDGLLEALVALW